MVEYLFAKLDYNELDDIEYSHIDYSYSYNKRTQDYKDAFSFYYEEKKDSMAEYLRYNSSQYVTDELVKSHISKDWDQLDSVDKEYYYIMEHKDKEQIKNTEYNYIYDFYTRLHTATDLVTYSTVLDNRIRFGYSKQSNLFFYYYEYDSSLYIHNGFENTVEGIYQLILTSLRDNKCDCDKCNQGCIDNIISKYNIKDITLGDIYSYISEIMYL